MKVSNFDVMKRMSELNLDIQLAPLSNIVNLQKVKAGTNVTIGVAGNVVAALGLENKYVGGLILANREDFNRIKAEMQSET